MDCKQFRKHHLAYLDDTLPGDLMGQAQHHVMLCNGCAAHDTLVRRSLMVVHSMPTIEPSAEFQAKLRSRLAACREARALELAPVIPAPRASSPRPTRAFVVVAASAMLGVMAYQALRDDVVPTLAMQPVIASRPASNSPAPFINPALMQAMATGNPVWGAAMVVEDAPVGFVNAEYSFAELR